MDALVAPVHAALADRVAEALGLGSGRDVVVAGDETTGALAVAVVARLTRDGWRPHAWITLASVERLAGGDGLRDDVASQADAVVALAGRPDADSPSPDAPVARRRDGERVEVRVLAPTHHQAEARDLSLPALAAAVLRGLEGDGG